MAFNDLERKRIENELDAFIESIRPPAHIRPELDYGYRLLDQSVELLEIRPQWNEPTIIRQHPFAKATFVKAKNSWKIYWLRQNLK